MPNLMGSSLQSPRGESPTLQSFSKTSPSAHPLLDDALHAPAGPAMKYTPCNINGLVHWHVKSLHQLFR